MNPAVEHSRLLRKLSSADTKVGSKIDNRADYCERNERRMRYPEFRHQKLFVGLGVIEAGCKGPALRYSALTSC
jgi:hypothetical protein